MRFEKILTMMFQIMILIRRKSRCSYVYIVIPCIMMK